MDDLVDVADVDLAGSVAIARLGDALDETRELRLVVGREERPRDAPSRLRPAILTAAIAAAA